MKIELCRDGRVLTMTGDIVYDDPPFLAAALVDAKGKDLSIYIGSNGGATSAGLAMKSLVRAYSGWVTTIAAGDCSSGAAMFLLQAGDHRMALEDSLLMFHQGTVGGGGGDWRSNEEWVRAETTQRERWVRALLANIKKVKPRMTGPKLWSKLRSDWVLTAEEALEWGLIDEILTVLP